MNSHKISPLKLLFVDDEAPIRKVMQNELPRMGHDLTVCEDGESALKMLENNRFDVAIVDLRMPGLSGWDVMDHIKKISPDTEVVISTGHGNMDVVIQAIRKGAFDFLPKPWKLVQIAHTLKRVVDKRLLLNKNTALEQRLKRVEGKSDIVGDSAGMQRVKDLVQTVAPTDSTVLILGENRYR